MCAGRAQLVPQTSLRLTQNLPYDSSLGFVLARGGLPVSKVKTSDRVTSEDLFIKC